MQIWNKKRCCTIGKYNDLYMVELYHKEVYSKPKRRGNMGMDRGN